jgi:hypothetical protein
VEARGALGRNRRWDMAVWKPVEDGLGDGVGIVRGWGNGIELTEGVKLGVETGIGMGVIGWSCAWGCQNGRLSRGDGG